MYVLIADISVRIQDNSTGSYFVNLEPWLISATQRGQSPNYFHTIAREDADHRAVKLPDLKAYVALAHEGARRRIRKVLRPTLHPFGPAQPGPDPAQYYPDILHPSNLKGYLGEVLAARFAEYDSPHGKSGWCVPAFPFNSHDAAITSYFAWTRNGVRPTNVPGQGGDDCVAFRMDDEGKITECLVCESKCLQVHNNQKLDEAHTGISRGSSVPATAWRIVELLDEAADEDSLAWAGAIRRDLLNADSPTVVRHDLVLYAYSKPARSDEPKIDGAVPHTGYSAGRPLHAVEVQFEDVGEIVREVYDGA